VGLVEVVEGPEAQSRHGQVEGVLGQEATAAARGQDAETTEEV